MSLEKLNNEIANVEDKKSIRGSIVNFEESLKNVEGAVAGDSDLCPLKHSFSDGMYVREIFIPEGTVLTGKIHKHDHPNFLMSGKVRMVTEDGAEEIEGPLSMISSAGTKRAIYALTDVVWITVHNNNTNTQDLSELEKDVIAPSYEAYDKFIAGKDNFVNRLKSRIIKRLSI